MKLVTGGDNTPLYTSVDGGATWTSRDSNRNWSGFASSTSGQKLAVGTSFGKVYISNGSVALPIAYTAPLVGGLDSFTFQVQDDSATDNLDLSPNTLTINSVGDPEIAVEQPAGTDRTDGSASIAFGTFNSGSSSAAKTFTVRNTGTSPLSISGVSFTGGNAGDFTVNTTGMAASVAAGGSTTFSVTFTPGASGARSTTLQIQNTDANENPFDITLTGNGNTAPIVSLNGFEFVVIEAGSGYTDAGATAADVEDGSLTPARSGSVNTASPGTYQFTYTATDSGGLSDSKMRLVKVIDTTAPVVAAHADVIVEATSAAGATVAYAPGSASDFVGVTSVVYSQNSGTNFPLGDTTVMITARDAANNVGVNGFTVTVRDTTVPVVSVPATIVAEATSAAGAVVTFSTSASDIVSGSTATSASPASGSTFPLGTTPVNVTSTDAAGNTGSNGFTITVRDTTAPAITVPANITTEATSAAGATVAFSVSASDIVSGAVSATATPASGSVFALGTTTVNVESTDTAGNVGNSSFTVTVSDTTAPVITVPSNITAEATSATGATVTFSVSASDIVNGATAATATPASGSVFPIGTTTVNVTSTDIAGNNSATSFTVTVRDTTGPVVTVPSDITEEATSASGATVTFSVSATDAVDGASTATATPASGSVFPIGTTTVTVTSPDIATNNGSASFTVTVRDTTAPAITAPADMTVRINSQTGAVVNFIVSATDIVDGAVSATATPASGSTFPIGDTTVNVTSTDAAGNTSNRSFVITVPDRTGPPAVDDALAVTATRSGVVYPLANDGNPAASIVSVSNANVEIDGRALVVPAGFTGTFTYTTSDGHTATVTVASASAVEAKRFSGLLFDATGKIKGRATMRRSAIGTKALTVYTTAGKGVLVFTGESTTGPTAVGAVQATIANGDQITVTVGGTLSGSLRPAMTSGVEERHHVQLGAIDAAIPGAGYGRVELTRFGYAKINVKMPDGRSYVASSELNEDGSVSFFGKQGGTASGWIGGELVLANLAKTDVTGELEWSKPAQASGLHRAGVNTVVAVNGCKTAGVVGIPDGPAVLTLSGGNFATPVTITTPVTNGMLPQVLPNLTSWKRPPGGGLTFRFGISQPGLPRTVGEGVFLPKSQTAVGFFYGTNVGGKIELKKP
jgi:hypothetical protein